MKVQATFREFVLKEWLLIGSGVGVVLSAFYAKRFPGYSIQEIEVLFILWVLFIVVKGLQQTGLILKIAKSIEKGRHIPLKLVLATFGFSMLATNDVALIVIVPLTLSLHIDQKATLVILEVLAANSGSALTPIGNPQNLYIYWFYHISPDIFIKTIAPFSLFFLGLLIVYALSVQIQNNALAKVLPPVAPKAYVYVGLLMLIFLTVLRVLPVLSGMVVILFVLVCDRQSLKVDYALLLSFLFFFGIADNLKIILASEISHSGHIFLLTSLASQVMSNVPATLLFAKFTSNWQALLWGSNVGGFGSLVGSLANLIAYKIYITHASSHDIASFTVKFFILGYLALLLSIGLYFITAAGKYVA